MNAYEAYKTMLGTRDVLNGINDMRKNLHNAILLAQMILEYEPGRFPEVIRRQAEIIVKAARTDGWPEASKENDHE